MFDPLSAQTYSRLCAVTEHALTGEISQPTHKTAMILMLICR